MKDYKMIIRICQLSGKKGGHLLKEMPFFSCQKGANVRLRGFNMFLIYAK